MLVPVLFYFEFCEILKTFSHISASRQAFVRRYFEASLCALSGDKYWKVRAKSKPKLDRYSLPVWSKPLAAPDGTDVARECIRRVLFAVVASWVAFISSLSGMNFAQLGFGHKPRNYTSLSVLLSWRRLHKLDAPAFLGFLLPVFPALRSSNNTYKCMAKRMRNNFVIFHL